MIQKNCEKTEGGGNTFVLLSGLLKRSREKTSLLLRIKMKREENKCAKFGRNSETVESF